MYLNQVNLVGRLVHTPSKYIKALPSGAKVLTMSIANNRIYKDKDGGKKETAEFHDIVMFGRTAEICAQYCVKGQEILVTGRLQTRSWEDKEGVRKYKTEVIVENFQMGQKPKNSTAEAPEKDELDQYDQPEGETSPAGTEASAGAPKVVGGIEYPTEEINPDDIPF